MVIEVEAVGAVDLDKPRPARDRRGRQDVTKFHLSSIGSCHVNLIPRVGSGFTASLDGSLSSLVFEAFDVLLRLCSTETDATSENIFGPSLDNTY
jgi:hypothetical protein